jgi:hypothetical protein
MSIPESYKDILTGLYQKTQKKQVVWCETAGGKGIVVFFKNYGLTIGPEVWNNFPHSYNIYLIDNNGKRIDDFSVSEEDDAWKLVNDLDALVHRQMNHVDDVLSEIRNAISKEQVVGRSFSEPDDIPF